MVGTVVGTRPGRVARAKALQRRPVPCRQQLLEPFLRREPPIVFFPPFVSEFFFLKGRKPRVTLQDLLRQDEARHLFAKRGFLQPRFVRSGFRFAEARDPHLMFCWNLSFSVRLLQQVLMKQFDLQFGGQI